MCFVWGLRFFFLFLFSLFLRNLFQLGALGSVSLEGHRSNLNDYGIVGGQLIRDCQWLGTSPPAGPQAAVREGGVKRTGQWGLSCPLSQTDFPVTSLCTSPLPSPSQGCRLRSHIPLHSSCPPFRSSRGDRQHFSPPTGTFTHKSPRVPQARSCCLQTAMQQEQPGAHGEHGFQPTTVLESQSGASKRYVRVSRTISGSVYSGNQEFVLWEEYRAVKTREVSVSLSLLKNAPHSCLVFNSASVVRLQPTLVFPQQVANNTHFSRCIND